MLFMHFYRNAEDVPLTGADANRFLGSSYVYLSAPHIQNHDFKLGRSYCIRKAEDILPSNLNLMVDLAHKADLFLAFTTTDNLVWETLATLDDPAIIQVSHNSLYLISERGQISPEPACQGFEMQMSGGKAKSLSAEAVNAAFVNKWSVQPLVQSSLIVFDSDALTDESLRGLAAHVCRGYRVYILVKPNLMKLLAGRIASQNLVLTRHMRAFSSGESLTLTQLPH